MIDRTRDNRTYAVPASLFFLTILSRIPFTSMLLYHTDSVQFALALEKYDITVHQPHPPGYFLYVMLGRIVHLLIEDANIVFVSINIFFSALTVVAVYYLGKEMFDHKTGGISALIALTSPNLWFHGEVALSYIVEAFFSTAVAFFCWKVNKGEHKYIWLSVIFLGIAGGFRQNTIVFLFPLWLYSVRQVQMKKIILSAVFLVCICIAWFVPMVQITGGWNVYREAFRELWMFNTGHNSVFEKGLSSLKIFASALFIFTFFSLGAGMFILCLAAYSMARKRRYHLLDKKALIFYSLWILPAFFFYLFVFISPSNPGYVLIYIPALCILLSIAITYINNDLKQLAYKKFFSFITVTVLISNFMIFYYSRYPVSYWEIKNHGALLSKLLAGIQTFNPQKSVVIVESYIFFGFRQLMYYLPQYRVYQVDLKVSQKGEVRQTFWGTKRETFLSKLVHIPIEFDNFILPLIADDRDKVLHIQDVNVTIIGPDFFIASGRIPIINEIYPKFKIVHD